jgi:alcohol dehydrogenase class IV
LAKATSLALDERRTPGTERTGLPADQLTVSVIAIPTTYAGSEMTPVYGITHRKDGTARKITGTDPRIAPKLVLYDPWLTLDLPPDMTASTGINALAHCVEAVYSISRNPLSTASALEGARHIAHALPRCHARGDDLEARTEMLTGAYLAGTALSSVAMGLHHGICHVLGGTLGVPHGLANAIILPHAMRYNADVCEQELAPVAQAMGITSPDNGDVALARHAADWVSEFAAGMNLPLQLRDVGVRKDQLPQLAELAAQSRTVQNNPKPITSTDLAAILNAAW